MSDATSSSPLLLTYPSVDDRSLEHSIAAGLLLQPYPDTASDSPERIPKSETAPFWLATSRMRSLGHTLFPPHENELEISLAPVDLERSHERSLGKLDDSRPLRFHAVLRFFFRNRSRIE